MPGLDGLDVARVLARFKAPPKVVFVTAYDEHAVEAFDLRAVDYLLKPVRAERLAEAVRRVGDALGAGTDPVATDDDETIAVELGGVTRFVQRSDVRFVEAQGDYARLHTAGESHLVRVPLTTLEEEWAAAGFVRIHRSHLVVAAAHRRDAGRLRALERADRRRRHCGQPPAHARAAGHAGAAGAAGPSSREHAASRRPPAAPGPRRVAAHAAPPVRPPPGRCATRSTSRPILGEVYMRSLVRPAALWRSASA